jgi:hypothetical protein
VPNRLYFDLAAVTHHARHAILADHNDPTRHEIGNHTPDPALWFYRSCGSVMLAGNGRRTKFEIGCRDLMAVNAQPHDALTTPAVRPPSLRDRAVLPLLDADGRSLFDLLCAGLAADRQWAMLDPQTLTLGVGRRRTRTPKPRAGRQPNLTATGAARHPE